jgi:hypothetical protein
MKQPLSYQTLPCSCWVTSVTNGLLCLYGDKKQIPGFVLRLLHSVLTDEGVYNSGTPKADWEIVMEAIATKCKMQIKSHKKEKVRNALLRVDFTHSVVVCDIGAGTHSILINQKEGDWYFGFDPDWDQVKSGKSKSGEYDIFPNVNKALEGRVNVKIHKDHLFNERATKHKIFAMGAVNDRNITVLSLLYG